jgi:beta-glucosidase
MHRYRSWISLIILVLLLFFFESCQRSAQEPYLDTTLSVEDRVDDLVARLTLEEKVSQLSSDAAAIERLNIPLYNWWNECLHGVARAGRATVFPQAIGLGATWDQDLIHRFASTVSDEARAKHHEFFRRGKRGIYQGLTFWTPNINIFRDPRWGRGMETYGEDPFLTASIGVQFVRGIQGNDPRYLKAVATPKHYAVHSGPEPDRHTFDAVVDDRDLIQTYLPQFEACVKEANALSAMCAYNRFRGEACCASELLLTQILRKEWGFQGYVVSDCGAIRDIHQNHKLVEDAPAAAALAVKAGCDLNCGVEYLSLVAAVERGLITEEEIDRSVKRLFSVRFMLGLFDPPEMVSYAQIPYSVLDSSKHQDLALETAHKSIVLLKNEGNLLPLKKDLKTIAVIGPNADDVDILLGNYNGDPTDPVTPLEGIRRKVGPETTVLFSKGCPLAENLPDFEVIPSSVLFTSDGPDKEQGLVGEYFASSDFNGKGHLFRELTYPNTEEFVRRGDTPSEPAFTRVDETIDFNWWDGSPAEELDDDNFGIRWTGYLVPPLSGEYSIGASGFNAFEIYLDEELLLSFNNIHHPSYSYETVELEAGRSYPIRVEFYETVNDAKMRLLWSPPGREREKEALDAAAKADVVIAVMGLSPRLEGEEMQVPVEGFSGGDRITLNIPSTQEELLKNLYAVGKPVVLVLMNGSALSINWPDAHIPAIVEAWYPGQAGGIALADVLFGDYNPAGRLPVTFYKSPDQLPPFEDYKMDGKTYRYFDGAPLYPFGHGLSYSEFGYQNLRVADSVENGNPVSVSVEVSNIGGVAGEEVVQLYVKDLEASVPVPILSLQGFERVLLKPGQSSTVEFKLEPKSLALIDESMTRVVEPGEFEVTVGGKQPGFHGNADASTTQTLSARFEITGGVYEVP